MNSLSLYLSQQVFLSSWFFVVLGIVFLVSRFFFCQHLKNIIVLIILFPLQLISLIPSSTSTLILSSHALLTCKISDEKCADGLVEVTLYVTSCSLLFSRFSFSLWCLSIWLSCVLVWIFLNLYYMEYIGPSWSGIPFSSPDLGSFYPLFLWICFVTLLLELQ